MSYYIVKFSFKNPLGEDVCYYRCLAAESVIDAREQAWQESPVDSCILVISEYSNYENAMSWIERLNEARLDSSKHSTRQYV